VLVLQLGQETLVSFKLQRWQEEHRYPFAEMQSDPEVMADLGGPFDLADSNVKFDRYRDAWSKNGISRWAVVGEVGTFLGYAGVMKRDESDHPLGVHYEIGWRFCRDAWGRGYATESARMALKHAWHVLPVSEIVSYTAQDNLRSQSVMNRLCLRRAADRDFTAKYDRGDWSGLVWIADRPR
jgi:RimJ/RimL family protein N-acetyltransferase